ncbi:MAG: LPXTG cell wall anchor domain-containing protein, partial [Ilumatobacteraceae bacterium]
PPTTTTTTPPTTTTTTAVISQLPATGPGAGGQTLPWFAVTFLLLGAASALAARRGAAWDPKDRL